MHRIAAVTLIGFLASLGTAHGEGPPPAIVPFVDDETAIVVHLDLTRLDVAKSSQRLFGPDASATGFGRSLSIIATWTEAIRKAGGAEVNLLFQLDPVARPPAVIVPLAAGADRDKLDRILLGRELGPSVARWPATAVIRGSLVAGEPRDLERFRRSERATPPAWLAEAMEGNAAGEVRIALKLSPEARKMLERDTAPLPPPFGGGAISGMVRGLTWASLRTSIEPKASLRLDARAKDDKAARDLEVLAEAMWKSFGEKLGGAGFAGLGPIDLKAEGDRVGATFDFEAIARLLRPAFERQRLLARRMGCMHNLRQIMLAMHNYHSTMNSFPPAFRANEAGKPLLSWRVLILPYLGQQELYNQFHLDEPWHSPHNKTLIARMPDVYKCIDANLPAGRTRYLTPRGEGTLFPGAQGVGIQQVTDGTSNTIAVVESGAGDSVVWTVPNDWEVIPAELKPETVLRSHPGGSNVGFADGSVHFLKGTINLQVLKALLTRAGGEVIAADAF